MTAPPTEKPLPMYQLASPVTEWEAPGALTRRMMNTSKGISTHLPPRKVRKTIQEEILLPSRRVEGTAG